MDDIRKYLPAGPNFAPFDSFASFISYVGALLLAVATIAVIIGFVFNLVKTATAALAGNSQKLAHNGKNTLINLGFIVGLVVLWGLVVNLIVSVGTKAT